MTNSERPTAAVIWAALAAGPLAGDRRGIEAMIEAGFEARAPRGESIPGAERAVLSGDVAVVPLQGVLFPRANYMTRALGWTDLESFGDELSAAAADPRVRSIVLDVNSPGGLAMGTAAAAEQVAAANRIKPVTAWVDGMAASAAYWVASPARKILADRTAALGSIGAVLTVSVQDRPDGDGRTEHTIVSSNAPLKRPDPRVPEGRAELQRQVDQIGAEMAAEIKGYRPALPDTRLGALEFGAEAVRHGLADGLAANLQEAIAAASAPKAASTTRVLVMTDLPAAPAATAIAAPPPVAPAQPSALQLSISADPIAEERTRVAEERTRVAAVLALRARYPMHALIDRLVATGASAADAEATLAAASGDLALARGAGELDRMRRELPGATAPNPPSASAAADDPNLEALSPEERFARDPKVRAMFRTVGAFVAFQKANAAGLIKINAPMLPYFGRGIDPRPAA